MGEKVKDLRLTRLEGLMVGLVRLWQRDWDFILGLKSAKVMGLWVGSIDGLVREKGYYWRYIRLLGLNAEGGCSVEVRFGMDDVWDGFGLYLMKRSLDWGFGLRFG